MNQKGEIKLVLIGIIIIAIGATVYALLTQKPTSMVIQSSLFTPAGTPKSNASPTITPTPISTPNIPADWKTYANEAGGYEFKYPSGWNVVFHPFAESGALFGPDAALSGSDGSVEPAGNLSSGQSLKNFVKENNLNIESGSTSETETVINGQTAIVSILPKAGTGNMESKMVSFERNQQVYNVSLIYRTNFSKYPADKIMLDNFNLMLSTFKFTK